MAEETYSARQVEDWEELVGNLRHHGIRLDPGDEREADGAIANICSEFGIYFHLPGPIAQIVEYALQIGYAKALGDVREGRIAGLGQTEDL